MRAGEFRPDFYERIRGFTLRLPPLRERRAGLLLLINYFVEKYNEEYKTVLAIPEGAAECLFRYDWPGSVHELRGVIRKAAAYADGTRYVNHLILQEVTRRRAAEVIRHVVPFDPSVGTWKDLMHRAQGIYFQALLDETHGNKKAVARLSGLSRSQFF